MKDEGGRMNQMGLLVNALNWLVLPPSAFRLV
jgi:hypothetical protein